MKKLFAAIATVVPTLAIALAEPVRVYTVPRGPTRAVLDRLSLTQAWKVRIPLESRRDGFFSFQILPGKDSTQIAIQTLSGTILLLNGETGDLLWRTTISQPYWSSQPVAYNSKSIFTTRRNQLHILNRESGRERLYTLDKDSKLPMYRMRLLSSPSSPPVADEDYLYLCLGNQAMAYRIPIFEEDERLRESEAKEQVPPERPSLQPEFAWNYVTGAIQLQQMPLVAEDQVGVVGTEGTFISLNRFGGSVTYAYKVHGSVSAPTGQHSYHAYIGSEDGTVYALDMRTGRLQWRFFTSGRLIRQPQVTDRDVFVVSERIGMYRADRQTGTEIWLNKSANRFLGTNQRFVYAMDRQGAMQILDYERGTTLASYDMRDWTVLVSNEISDRLYFASHDGQVLCLHHRDQRKPLTIKTTELAAPKQEAKPKDEKKEIREPEKEKEAEKEAGKDKVVGWPGLNVGWASPTGSSGGRCPPYKVKPRCAVLSVLIAYPVLSTEYSVRGIAERPRARELTSMIEPRRRFLLL